MRGDELLVVGDIVPDPLTGASITTGCRTSFGVEQLAAGCVHFDAGNGTYALFSLGLGGSVDIDLNHQNLAFILVGQVLDCRGNLLAGSTPRGVKVDDNDCLRVLEGLLKIRVVEDFDFDVLLGVCELRKEQTHRLGRQDLQSNGR